MYDYDLNTFEFDSNGDGVIDTYVEDIDTTGDGYCDTHIESCDTNKSGMIDTVLVAQDTTCDGAPDVVTKMHDYNQDGEIDSMNIHKDADGDGQYEVLVKAYDSTNDGQLDKAEVYVDVKRNGNSQYHNLYSYDSDTGQLIPDSAAAPFEVSGTNYTELDNYDPSQSNPDAVSGDPAEAIEVWECQGNTNRCALYSEKFVIEELSGQDIDIEDFSNVAKENGWFTEEGGTSLLNMNNMLDYYGVENQMSFHKSVEDIEDCLNSGGKVIVSIDADEIWYGTDNNIFAPESGANHAVEVIGVDRTDPLNPMVILNDSGSPTGKGEMVPLDVFEGAWEDGDRQMIECYA